MIANTTTSSSVLKGALVAMSVLPDGTIYAQRTQLDAPSQQLTVVVDNSGYRRSAP